MRLLFTRHAETEQNACNIIQYQDHNDFSEKGFYQISKLIERLENEKIDLIISSDLPRCKITAQNISKEINCNIEYSKELREKDDGLWVGKKKTEIDWDSLKGSFETRKAPNGESLEEVRERGEKIFKELLEKYRESDKTILVVSHGTFLRILIGNLLGLGLYDSIFKFHIKNCSLSEIDINKDHKEGYKLTLLNETGYLN